MSVNPEQKAICLHPDCKRVVFENKDKCILHCEKDDWYSSESEKWDEDKVREFWRVVYDLWGRGKSLEKVFFPPVNDSDKLSNNFSSNLRTKNGILFEFNKLLKISDSTFLGDFKLSYKFKFEGFFFINVKFLGDFEINHATVNANLYFKDVIFFKKSNFVLLRNKKLEFFKTSFKKTLNIFELKDVKEVTITDNSEINKVILRDCSIESLDLGNVGNQNTKISQISICNSFIKSILIRNLENKIDIISLRNTDFNILEIKGLKELHSLYIADTSACLDFFQCEKVNINNLNFSSFNVFNSNTIFFKTVNVNVFNINRLIGTPKFVSFNDFRIEDKFVIKDSNLSNFEFHDANISKANKTFKNISFISNKGNTIFNGVIWGDISKKFDIATHRDTYRQLKYANEQQGNFIEANKFYSAEMEAYKNELFHNTKLLEKLLDKIIFFLNNIISNFSQNWGLPLLWYFIFGFTFAFLYYSDFEIISHYSIPACMFFVWSGLFFFIEYFKYDSTKFSIISLLLSSCLNYFHNVRNSSISQFITFVNPFNTSGLEGNEARLIWWILFRMISVFAIYQFIISLRRQTRR